MPKAKVNDINMYYELHGAGDPVVLIQGLGGNHTFWQPNLPNLIKKHQILLLDYRGAGDSDKPDMPYSTRLFADDIAALMEALDIPRAISSGRSMGGCIAQYLGIAHPDKVRSLVLAATWGRADEALKLCLANWSKIVELVGLEGLFDHVLPWCWTREFFEPEHAEELAELKRLVYANRQPRDAFVRQSLAGQEHDALSGCPRFRLDTRRRRRGGHPHTTRAFRRDRGPGSQTPNWSWCLAWATLFTKRSQNLQRHRPELLGR